MMNWIYHPYIVGLPLLIALAFIPAKSKLSFIFNSIIVGLYIYIIYNITLWVEYGSYYLKFLFILFFIGAFYNGLRIINQSTPTKRWLQILLFTLKIITFFALVIVTIEINLEKEEPTIDLSFPLKNGTFYITNEHIDYTQSYAFDITKLNKLGREWNGFFKPTDLNNYIIYKDTVYSPCNGIVSDVERSQLDHRIGDLEEFKIPANKVVIKVGDKSVELLHLLYNSTFVDEGDSICVGQPIGLVGNSGMSRHPHLHINVVKNDVLLEYLPSIPFSLDKKIITNSLYKN